MKFTILSALMLTSCAASTTEPHVLQKYIDMKTKINSVPFSEIQSVNFSFGEAAPKDFQAPKLTGADKDKAMVAKFYQGFGRAFGIHYELDDLDTCIIMATITGYSLLVMAMGIWVASFD